MALAYFICLDIMANRAGQLPHEFAGNNQPSVRSGISISFGKIISVPEPHGCSVQGVPRRKVAVALEMQSR